MIRSTIALCGPPPPPPVSCPPQSLKSSKKPQPNKVNTSLTIDSGCGTQDLLDQIRKGKALRTAEQRAARDVKPKPANSLSDILGGALAKIKEANKGEYGEIEDVSYSLWD